MKCNRLNSPGAGSCKQGPLKGRPSKGEGTEALPYTAVCGGCGVVAGFGRLTGGREAPKAPGRMGQRQGKSAIGIRDWKSEVEASGGRGHLKGAGGVC